jgi:subtilisin family serine protease
MAGEPWGAFPRLINQDDAIAHFPGINGSGQAIAIIDTGVNYKHPALGGGFGPGFKVVAGYDFVDNDSDPLDVDGHGTGIAGVIGATEFVFEGARYRGLAPGAKIIALRTSGGSGGGAQEDLRIELALQWVLANRAQYNIVAINLSTGSGAHSAPTQEEPFADEFQSLINAGVFIAASSGNSGVRTPFAIEYPAADPNVFAIGSVNSNDVISRFTERSADLDLLTPGENVPTAYYDAVNRKHVYLAATGTSFAAPHAAAAAALLRQVDPTLTPWEIMDILESSGSQNFDGDRESGTVTGLTFARLNIDAAIAMAIRAGDDDFEDNDSLGAAATLNFSGDNASATNLRLMASDNDFFRFTLPAAAKVDFTYQSSTGQGATFELYTASGVKIANLGSSHTRELPMGTYILKVVAPTTTLTGTYRIDIHKSNIPQPPSLMGTRNDIAYDSAGNLHVVYADSNSGGVLRYITRSASGAWSSTRIVDKSVSGASHLSLAISAKGTVGIAYYDSSNKDLKYAQLNGSTFSVTRIDSKGTVGEFASLAFSHANKPGVSYYSRSGGNLKLAAMGKTNKWAISTVDSGGDVGRYTSLALNPKTGQWAIAYVNNTGGLFKYAEKIKSGAWKLMTVEDTKRGGGFTSLAFDKSGRPNMSYFMTDGENLRYAHFDGKRWTKQTVASSGTVGSYSNLLFDSTGAATIFAYNLSADTAVMATLSAGRWTATNVASGGGNYISAALSPSGIRTFIYRDSASGTLRLGSV